MYVDELVEDGVAFADGRLKAEDRILEINGENVRDAPQEKVRASALFLIVTAHHLFYKSVRQSIRQSVLVAVGILAEKLS